MKEKAPKGQSDYIYNEQGTSEVSEQIMDAYNSGVIGHENGQFKFLKEEKVN